MKYNVYDCETRQTFLMETKHGRVLRFESHIKLEAKRRAKVVRKELERLIMEEGKLGVYGTPHSKEDINAKDKE